MPRLIPSLETLLMSRLPLPALARHALVGALGLGLWPACQPAHAVEPVVVTVTDKGCEPSTLEVPAGKTVFSIHNASRRAMEWEVLQGVMVVAERENIVPGFRVALTATLDPGEYQMTCGLLSNPRGLLRVLAAAASGTLAPPSPMDLVGPIAEYKVYVIQQVDALVAATRPFTEAVKAGDLAQAQRLYAPARLYYERVEPIAELCNDLDSSIDARADDFERKEEDASWTGFHRIEKGLFADKSTAGLAPVADKLLADTIELQKRLKTLVIKPKDMVGGAAALIEEVASKKIGGEEDRYSRTDLWDFQANLDGAQKIVALLRPLLQPRNPQLLAQIDGNFAKVDAILAKYKAGKGFQRYDALSQSDRNTMKGAVAVLAEDLSKLRGTLGVD